MGIFCGLGAAALYAAVVIMNQKLKNVSTYDKTIMQLSAATLILLPYIFLTEDLSALILKEPVTAEGVLGAVLVLGATMISELPEKQR